MVGTTVNLTLIAVYASTLDAAEETKYSFYDDLQDAVDRIRKVQSRGHGNMAYP